MARILRPEEALLIRDEVDVLSKVRKIKLGCCETVLGWQQVEQHLQGGVLNRYYSGQRCCCAVYTMRRSVSEHFQTERRERICLCLIKRKKLRIRKSLMLGCYYISSIISKETHRFNIITFIQLF